MKKLIVLLMIICLVTCGCSKQNEPTTTDTPSTTVTETPTKSESEPETNTNKMACALCGEITDCTAFTQKRYNYDIGDYIKKVYYLCDDCYLTASKNETDCLNYEMLFENLQLAMAAKDCYKVISALEGEGYVYISQTGIKFENVEQVLIDQLRLIDSKFEEIKTNNFYQIKISYGKYANIKKDMEPVSIFDTIIQ